MGPYIHKNHPMSLLIRKLKYDTSPSMVREKFKKFGSIKDVYLPIDYYTKEPRGFGFVEFYDAKDAEQALKEMNGSEIDGNVIEVFVAQKGRSDPKLMKNKEKGAFAYRKNPDNKIRRRYISKSNSRYRSYSRDRIRRRDRSRERYRYRDSSDKRIGKYRDKKNYLKNYNSRYRNKDYDRNYSRSRRSKEYRNDYSRYREKRRYYRDHKSNSRRRYSSQNKYDSRDKYDKKLDNYKSKYDSNDDYSGKSIKSSKHSKNPKISKSISFNTEKDDVRKKNENINEKDHSNTWKESESRNADNNKRDYVNSIDGFN